MTVQCRAAILRRAAFVYLFYRANDGRFQECQKCSGTTEIGLVAAGRVLTELRMFTPFATVGG